MRASFCQFAVAVLLMITSSALANFDLGSFYAASVRGAFKSVQVSVDSLTVDTAGLQKTVSVPLVW